MEPLVSVIIPVYNVLPYLREALDSVINQTYKNLEILIVDDGSTDGSEDVCDEYLSDPRVIVIHQENKGLSGARNTGLDRMTGEYVAFLDSDDAFTPEMIEKMLGAIIRNQAAAAVCGYFAYYTDQSMSASNVRKVRNAYFDEECVLSSAEALNLMFVGKVSWAVWNKLYRHTVWDTVRFPEGDNYEDMRIMCRIIEQCDHIVTVPEIYILYRQRTGSITKTQSEKNLRDYLLAVHTVENYIQAQYPEKIPTDSLRPFQEQHARALSDQYARLLLHSHSSTALEEVRKEILTYWKNTEGVTCQFHSRITRFLFLHAPALLIPARSCWRFGIRLIEKVQT